jgi:hypothetical protein
MINFHGSGQRVEDCSRTSPTKPATSRAEISDQGKTLQHSLCWSLIPGCTRETTRKDVFTMGFTEAEKSALYAINELRDGERAPTRQEIEGVVGNSVLVSLEGELDVAFDENGDLVYAPYPRRGE